MISNITLTTTIGSFVATHAAYAYGAPGEKGSRAVRAEHAGIPLSARIGVGRGRGNVVSYVLYVTFPADLIATIPNGRALDRTDGADRTRGGKRVGSADYLFQLTQDEAHALLHTANPETALIGLANIPEKQVVIRTPGIAIPTRYGFAEAAATEVNAPASEVIEEASEPKPARRQRVKNVA